MSSSTAVFSATRSRGKGQGAAGKSGRLDASLLLGIAIACVALIAGIAVTGVSARYFFQPTGVLIVVGGTAGIMLITTPRPALLVALRRTIGLFVTPASPAVGDLVEEIVGYAKVGRTHGLLALEPAMEEAGHAFLREGLLLAMDVHERAELKSALENKIRLCERQSEAAAKVLEVAGGFTPTIGVLGTIVGLIDVLRQFSSVSAIAYGVGAAFTSTIYGLGLANLVLLPAAHRIRARAAQSFDLQELMAEGVLCLFDGMHPRLVQQRLETFLGAEVESPSPQSWKRPAAAGAVLR